MNKKIGKTTNQLYKYNGGKEKYEVLDKLRIQARETLHYDNKHYKSKT